jgi:hypothetical protein
MRPKVAVSSGNNQRLSSLHVHRSSHDAGVGVQLVCYAADALCHQRKLHLVQKPAACVCMCCLIQYVRRFGGSFPAHRVKTASSFFSTLAISFPVGSLGEEFGWRGVMAPYINTLLDRRFGISRSWKWTPLLQSLITGVIWAVCELSRSSYQQRI